MASSIETNAKTAANDTQQKTANTKNGSWRISISALLILSRHYQARWASEH